ncbi:hypothetical protein [Streptomyces cinereospinus]|uniref:Uncharacterized protein n=1 Tax=Streptomyces cinereospinus TaxID=285561 RepID=A0ABV5N5F0_9ACTN
MAGEQAGKARTGEASPLREAGPLTLRTPAGTAKELVLDGRQAHTTGVLVAGGLAVWEDTGAPPVAVW